MHQGHKLRNPGHHKSANSINRGSQKFHMYSTPCRLSAYQPVIDIGFNLFALWNQIFPFRRASTSRMWTNSPGPRKFLFSLRFQRTVPCRAIFHQFPPPPGLPSKNVHSSGGPAPCIYDVCVRSHAEPGWMHPRGHYFDFRGWDGSLPKGTIRDPYYLASDLFLFLSFRNTRLAGAR